jgi:hypothetical protein
VHTGNITKRTTFWNVTPCSTVDVHRRLGGMYCRHLWCWRVSQARSRQRGGFISSFLGCANIFLYISFLRTFSLCLNLRERNHIPWIHAITTTLYSASLYIRENPRYIWQVWRISVCFFYLCPYYIRVSAVCFGICSNEINCAYTSLPSFFFLFFLRNWRHSAWMPINFIDI